MPLIRIVHAPGLLRTAQLALGLSQAGLGDLLGCSRRTMTRWGQGANGPNIAQWSAIVQHLYPVNRALAAQVASEIGETFASLGLEQPAAPVAAASTSAQPSRPEPAVSDLVDSVVCAAAEAIATTPQAVRPALLAAFDRAASVSLGLDDVRTALRAATAKT